MKQPRMDTTALRWTSAEPCSVISCVMSLPWYVINLLTDHWRVLSVIKINHSLLIPASQITTLAARTNDGLTVLCRGETAAEVVTQVYPITFPCFKKTHKYTSQRGTAACFGNLEQTNIFRVWAEESCHYRMWRHRGCGAPRSLDGGKNNQSSAVVSYFIVFYLL